MKKIGPPVYPKPNSVERIPFFNHLSIKQFKNEERYRGGLTLKVRSGLVNPEQLWGRP